MSILVTAFDTNMIAELLEPVHFRVRDHRHAKQAGC
jgi:hypothetical protein